MTRKIVVVYKSDNGDLGESLNVLTQSLKDYDVTHVPREDLLEKDTRGALVLVAGGDGTLLGASHRILDNYSLVMGVRLRERSAGYYTACDVEKITEAVQKVIDGKEGRDYKVVRYPRLECIMHTDSGNWVRTDLALNEFFIANTCAYFPSKYTIMLDHAEYNQRSSGLIVCTQQGYGGWAKWCRTSSPAFPNEGPKSPDEFHVYVRELMGKGPVSLDWFPVGRDMKFLVRSDMHRGYIVPDSFDEYHFNRGTELEVRFSDRPLAVVRLEGKKWRTW